MEIYRKISTYLTTSFKVIITSRLDIQQIINKSKRKIGKKIVKRTTDIILGNFLRY